MKNPGKWLIDFNAGNSRASVDGLVSVHGYDNAGRPAEEVLIMEKAKLYHADAVFFEAPHDDRPPIAQAFLYCSDELVRDPDFAALHQRLWSWGGVPLIFRFTNGLVQLFRCAHGPDFVDNGKIVCRPFKTLELASKVASDPWWDAERLHTGTLWDDPEVCKELLSSSKAAQKTLINAVRDLHQKLNKANVLPKPLRRYLLILSVLVAYLEKRGVFETDFFARFRSGASEFFEVLADGPALINLLDHLEERFNGNVFVLSDEERKTLRTSNELSYYAQLVEGRQEPSGQLTLWQRYSFADLPVELISHIYQLFVQDAAIAVYTPHFVVRLMLGEVLNWERLDRLEEKNEVILDPACGSGIFLVEAYKRLILHWRLRHNWQRPDQTSLQKLLTTRLRGIDLEEGAVELAAFSLCLALCDALEPIEIRTSVKLFPALKEQTIYTSCFFEASEKQIIKDSVGVLVGNPPFDSRLSTKGAERAYHRYQQQHGSLADKQVAYLFLHESMEMLAPGGILCMLQQYNFLYNQQSLGFRHKFFERWDVREILDFISIRGLFKKGDADTKVIVVVAEAQIPSVEQRVLHVTFRRNGRTSAGQGFEIDYYDMHWLPRKLILHNDAVWRCNLLGGGRVLNFVDRLKTLRTLGQYASEKGWDYGEGYIEGAQGKSRPASHIIGKPVLPSEAITAAGIDESAITIAPAKPIEGPRSEKRFTPPMILVRQHMDLFHSVWTKHYLTYKNKVVGFCASSVDDLKNLQEIDSWLESESTALRAYVAAISVRLFTQKATTLSYADIDRIPYPAKRNLELSKHDQVIIADIVNYYRDLIRLGEESAAMKELGISALPAFNDTFTRRINGIYRENQLHSLVAQAWPGVICQPYMFGQGEVDWSNADELKGKLDALLVEKRGGLTVTRVARVYDGTCIYLLKPDRLRYWLRSVALRDADETLADLAEQGF